MTWRPLPGDAVGQPRRLGASLDGVVRSLGGPGAQALVALFARWAEIAGPAAAHCRPVGMAGTTLVVAVDEPARATDLRYRGAELLARVSEVVGPGVAERLEVRVRPSP
ncbi:MAG: DUF721 domain-containing protein [Actinomycetota bacterium]|nr:DUF721 domain-containing protein [Actinomycetota bacterium]